MLDHAELITKVQDMTDNDPSQYMRSNVRELKNLEGTVRKHMQEDIRYKSYKIGKSHPPPENLVNGSPITSLISLP
jgi:hypothetical protein